MARRHISVDDGFDSIQNGSFGKGRSDDLANSTIITRTAAKGDLKMFDVFAGWAFSED